MDNPECCQCGGRIEDEQTFVDVGGGTVHRTEPQYDAGGGKFHPKCAIKYIRSHYGEE